MFIQEALDNLLDWSNRNGMQFNSTKCTVIHLEANTKNFYYKLRSQSLAVSEEKRYLGVLVDYRITMTCQYDAANAKRPIKF